MEANQPLAKKRAYLYLGLVFVMVSFAVTLYYYYYHLPKAGGYQIEVKGNQQLSEEDIRGIIVYLIEGQSKGVTTKEIEEALLLNPRIAKAKVEIKRGKKLIISIEENRLGYLLSRPGMISEVGQDGTIIQESIERGQSLPADMPIFYLTGDQTMQKQLIREKGLALNNKSIRDIISLWGATREEYAFIWGRIAEIELRLGAVEKLVLYAAHVRAQIVIASIVDKRLLERLWALFYYLEKVKNKANMRSWYIIELGEKNALIKKVRTS